MNTVKQVTEALNLRGKGWRDYASQLAQIHKVVAQIRKQFDTHTEIITEGGNAILKLTYNNGLGSCSFPLPKDEETESLNNDYNASLLALLIPEESI